MLRFALSPAAAYIFRIEESDEVDAVGVWSEGLVFQVGRRYR